jgi:hypothetical protein
MSWKLFCMEPPAASNACHSDRSSALWPARSRTSDDERQATSDATDGTDGEVS